MRLRQEVGGGEAVVRSAVRDGRRRWALWLPLSRLVRRHRTCGVAQREESGAQDYLGSGRERDLVLSVTTMMHRGKVSRVSVV